MYYVTVLFCVHKHNIDVHTYLCLLIVSHFIVLIIVTVLEKLAFNCQVHEAKRKADKEKCILLVKVNPRGTILTYPLSVLSFFLSQVSS